MDYVLQEGISQRLAVFQLLGHFGPLKVLCRF
jgi:hypothetical protein